MAEEPLTRWRIVRWWRRITYKNPNPIPWHNPWSQRDV
jgi:hypothetical protein